MIHDPGLNQNIDQIKGQAENAWRTILEVLKRLKETVKAPNALLDQLQIIFRDESKLKKVQSDIIVSKCLHFSREKQHLLRIAWSWPWNCRWMHDWTLVS